MRCFSPVSSPISALSVLSALSLATAIGCTTAPEASTDIEASPSTTAALTSWNAGYCEMFVDKVAVEHDSHSFRQYRLFLKVLNGRLDSAITRIGMRATAHQHNGSASCIPGAAPTGFCDPAGTWTDLEAVKLAPDYFELDLTIGVFDYARQVEGVFFVETERGTTYWVHAGDGGNFFLDDAGIGHVENALHGKGVSTPLFTYSDYTRLPTTADFYPYLNPARCR